MIILVGPGGIGRSTLAIEVASRLSATYTGGAVFIDLAAIVDSRLMSPRTRPAGNADGRVTDADRRIDAPAV